MIKKLPKWIIYYWLAIMPGLTSFLGRLSYEYFYLTAKNGPQMIGFSLMHAYPLIYIIMVLSFFASIIWLIIYAKWMIKTYTQKKRPSYFSLFISTLLIVLIITFLEPISKLLY